MMSQWGREMGCKSRINEGWIYRYTLSEDTEHKPLLSRVNCERVRLGAILRSPLKVFSKDSMGPDWLTS